jgi:FKBP-type peptidyl-prolyl cis-trans isomerase
MSRTSLLRRLTPVALLAASALVLGGCGSDSKDKKGSTDSSSSPSSSPSNSSATGCGDYSPGDTSDSVKVDGTFGETQTATFKTPLKATDLERTVVDEGDGDKTAKGDSVDVLLSLYLGKDGKALGSQPATLTVGDTQILPAFTAGLDCVPIGSRVVVTVPASDVYGSEGKPDLGITADDSLVIVTDVIGQKKLPATKAWTKDVPDVSFDGKGTPTVKLPGKKPPAGLLLKVLRKGDGAVVKSGDSVTVDYQGTDWNTGKIFDQSYGKQPASFVTSQVVPGFGAALVGQKVGTRLIVSIPPEYGYGSAGNAQAGIGGTDTLVFVVEIHKTGAAAQ